MRSRSRQLHAVFYFHKFPFDCWRRILLNDVQHSLVKLASRDSAFLVFKNLNGCFYGFDQTLFGQCRSKNNRHICKRSCFATHMRLKLLHCIGFFFNQIPFVDQHHNSFSVFFCQPKDILVLGFETTGCIHHQNRNITMFDRPDCPHDRIKFEVFRNFGLFSDSSSIHQVEFKSKTGVFRINGITCGSCHIGHNISFFANQRIDKGRFSCVGPSYNCKSRQFRFLRRIIFIKNFRKGHVGDQSIQQLSCPRPIDGGNGVVVPEPQIVKFYSISSTHGIVDFVDG